MNKEKCVLNKEELRLAADFFKVMGDETRLKILVTLLNKELCVNEIAECIEMSQSSVSHQLKTLRISKLIKSRREGKMIYYSLDDEHVKHIFDEGLKHITE